MHRFEEGHEETLVVAAGDEHVARFVVRAQAAALTGPVMSTACRARSNASMNLCNVVS